MRGERAAERTGGVSNFDAASGPTCCDKSEDRRLDHDLVPEADEWIRFVSPCLRVLRQTRNMLRGKIQHINDTGRKVLLGERQGPTSSCLGASLTKTRRCRVSREAVWHNDAHDALWGPMFDPAQPQ